MTTSELLAERYEVGEVIGRGGMAVVRRARDVRLGRDVAIKVLRPDLAGDAQFLLRFRREAQAAAGLDAPCIVAVYDTGEDAEQVPWIAMELVEGRTLRDVLQDEGRLLPQRALEVTADVCAALDVAHGHGIIHRDIKPGNVMLTRAGEVKVMDFGIARAASVGASTATETAAVIGTAAYLSPEQARGEHVDARSDLYSTGCLLYELLTGVPPFTGDSAVAVAYQHVREDPVAPSQYDPALAGDVDAVVLKALAKNPANRYQDALEMRADLLRAAAGEPTLATPLLADEPVAVRPSKTRRRVFWGIVLALLVAVAVGVGLLVHLLLGPGSDLFDPPDVKGLTQAVAEQQLSADGLNVDKVTARYDAAVAAGTVIDQSPQAGFLVHRGGTVDLTVSLGAERALVPRVQGHTQGEATADLAAVKLQVKVVTRDVDVPAGTVVNLSPAPGTQVAVGSTVTLVVSTGDVQVPDVRGLSQDLAVARLGAAGFGIGLQPQFSDQPPGTVLSQDVVGTLAPRGSSVVLQVAAAQPAPVAPTPVAPTPPPSAPAPAPTG